MTLHVKIPQMVTAEVRRLTSSPMAMIALFALMCVPLLYGGLYLWANQDPYARLDQVPAAIVIEDAGITVAGADRNYGEDVAEQLVTDGSFDWHIVDPADATTGVDAATYDFSITFPSDFSSSLASASTGDPHQATVVLTTNDTNAYLASSIGEQAAAAIQVSIVQKVNQEAASQFLVGLSDVRGQLVSAVDGADQLATGSAEALTGADALVAGTSKLSDGAGTLSGATDDLADGAATLAQGAKKVAAGNAALASKADAAAQDADDAVAALPLVRKDIADRLAAQGLDEQQIDEALAALDPLGEDLSAGNAQLQGVVDQVDALASGAQQAADGSVALRDGAAQVATGASDLASGAADAADGSASLAAGVTSLHDGSVTLADGLGEGVDQIPSSSEQLRADQAATIAQPVDLENTTVTAAGNYGAGLAPFFVSLAAWIGIYALFLIVKPVSRRAVTAMHSPLRITAAGWLTPGLLGAAQMVGLFAIVSWALNFNVVNPLATYGLMALASLTFAAMILALNVWLGSVGQFLGLVLMVIQLVTAGGTFPWQTLPAPLASLHHVLPMSYAVDGIRQTMYGGSASAAWVDAGVLGAWMFASLAIAAIGVVRMTHVRTLRDLQPSLIG